MTNVGSLDQIPKKARQALMAMPTGLPTDYPFKIEGDEFHFGPFVFDYYGLKSMDDEATLTDFSISVRFLSWLQSLSAWALGDAFRAGYVRFREQASQLEGDDGPSYDYATERRLKWICGVFPREDRVVPLSIWAYEKVAAVPDREIRLALLRAAYDQGWTQAELRERALDALGDTDMDSRPLFLRVDEIEGGAKKMAERCPRPGILRAWARELNGWAERIEQGFRFGEEADDEE